MIKKNSIGWPETINSISYTLDILIHNFYNARRVSKFCSPRTIYHLIVFLLGVFWEKRFFKIRSAIFRRDIVLPFSFLCFFLFSSFSLCLCLLLSSVMSGNSFTYWHYLPSPSQFFLISLRKYLVLWVSWVSSTLSNFPCSLKYHIPNDVFGKECSNRSI